jgi:hypothetical protein
VRASFLIVAGVVFGFTAVELGAAPRGGLDGAVLRVTTLAAAGPGSLREALERKGPRLVVFEVGGVIDLAGRSLTVTEPYLTLAGQTAPDPGITLIRGGLSVEAHDVVIQHLAVRPGDDGKSSSWEPDALGARRGPRPVHDVLFENCSATWAVDENLSVSGPADVTPARGKDATSRDVTLRRCLVAEGLSRSSHSKGEHSKGTLVHDGVTGVEIVGCLYASNRERNPRLKGGSRALVAHNVVYNWGAACVGMGAHGNREQLEGAEAALLGNLAVAGPDTRSLAFVKAVDPGAAAYASGNVAVDANGAPLLLAEPGVSLLEAPPGWTRLPAALEVAEVVTAVLRGAGSRPARRDAIDARIVASVIRGDGRIIDSQRQVGGYPERAPATRALQVPDGADARQRWLAGLSEELALDSRLDVKPLLERLRIKASR